jgi:phage gpG-like protein
MPTGPDMTVKVEGDTRAELSLISLGRRARELHPVSGQIQRVYLRSEQERFSRQGPGWPPLKTETADRKAREGLPPSMLRATDRLYRSLTTMFGPDQERDTEGSELKFGTTLHYAHFHDRGTRFMPKRKLIDLTVGDREQITRLVSEHIAKGEAL